MARLLLIGMAFALSTVPALAKPPAERQNGWQTDELRIAKRDFAVPHTAIGNGSKSGSGSRIIAGEELTANGMIGFGIFGEKTEKSLHSPSIARELNLPKQRKAGIGFSLKF